MPIKTYHFDFYQCVTRNATANAPAKTTGDIFRALHTLKTNGRSTAKDIGKTQFELRQIDETDFGFRGTIGKHRANDLPHAAVVGGDEREIALEDNENLLEKAQFHFYEDHQLLILQRNIRCINYDKFCKYLRHQGYVTALNPVIEPTDLKWLIDDKVGVKTATLSIARPRNPELFNGAEHNFNNTLFSALGGTNTAVLNLALRGDGRSDNPDERYLCNSFKRGIREMQNIFEVKKCKLILENNETHVTHPVDLILDRLVHSEEIEVEGRYPPSFEIWEALTQAREQRENELTTYFGDINSPQLA